VLQAKAKSISDTSYSIKSQNPMWFRGASAALKSGNMDVWPYLPAWHKAYIIATVEEDILIYNTLNG
jgi:hypothetical protein